ncbi:hypothetical protein KB553_14480 [Chryseobacterium rhizoplanae]|uniref:hypothetical protein n=1 Tax=Chryseobacterium rhizoplanae TaxID=1609531 RepID=UPI001CE283B7|nr:hypothetical protein [Chryseobacterium rhizoplanae]UCA58256.1 hypothetical protein KB553_14480 [Chryseobacterium rhizoplanae]
MENFYTIIFTFVLILIIAFPLYLSGRVWFALSPFIINYYSSEKRNWYNTWNNDRFIIVLSLAILSIALSAWWGVRILSHIERTKVDFTEILFFLLLHLICAMLLEMKMDHPFKPLSAFREFQKNKYNDRFIFKDKLSTDQTLNIHTTEIKQEILISKKVLSEEIKNQNVISDKTYQLAQENNRLLHESDFPFEIRKSSHISITDIMEEFSISYASEKVLSDFLIRKRKTGKIIFEKAARRGVSVQPIMDFFSKYTNLIELCKTDKAITQADTVKIINEIVIAKDRKGNLVNSPIDSKNLSKYLS